MGDILNNNSEIIKFDDLVTENVSLKEYTTIHTGGSADLAAFPSGYEELRTLLREADRQNIPVTVIGAGSNILISDDGVEGLVIFTHHLNSVHTRGSLLCARCGSSLDKAINTATSSGLSGIEKLGGIPGTIGGAVNGNCGAYGVEISQFLHYVDYLTLDGKIHRMSINPADFTYRHSPFSDRSDVIIFEAGLKLNPTHQDAIARQIKEEVRDKRREDGQYEFACAGSFFKNPSPDSPAGKIIDDCGFRGYELGNAMVSPHHANFIVNPARQATSSEIYELSRVIREEVRLRTGIELEYEIKFIGRW